MPNDAQKAVILAVDDAPENLDVVRNLLAPRFTVKAATNGMVALKIAAKQPPDLVLLDIQMPGMDGYEVCRQLKADPATATIPVVFLTGESGVDAEVAAAGGCGCATKPVDPATLMQLIDQLLGGAE